MWFCNPIIIFYLSIDKNKKNVYNNNRSKYGEVAQLARAFGSYPKGHVFESHLRYQQKRTVYKNSSFFMYFNKNNGKGRKKFFINKNCNFMK